MTKLYLLIVGAAAIIALLLMKAEIKELNAALYDARDFYAAVQRCSDNGSLTYMMRTTENMWDALNRELPVGTCVFMRGGIYNDVGWADFARRVRSYAAPNGLRCGDGKTPETPELTQLCDEYIYNRPLNLKEVK